MGAHLRLNPGTKPRNRHIHSQSTTLKKTNESAHDYLLPIGYSRKMAPTKIVALETFFCPLPDFSSLPFEVSLEAYSRSTPEDIPGRIVDASIIIVTTLRLARAVLARDVCPHLRLIVVMASGTNNIDIEACKDRNIQVKNCPGANTDAVAQHALALFLACRRKLVQLHHATLGTNGESANGKGAKSPWEAEGTLMSRLLDRHGKAPVGLGDEVVGIIGFGRVGKDYASVPCLLVSHNLSIGCQVKQSQISAPRSG